jgi:cell division septation protein DedD
LAGLFLLAALVVFGCGRAGSSPSRLIDFSVEFGEHSIPNQMTAGQRLSAEISVKNASKNTWPSNPDGKGHRAVNLSYHWLDRRGDMVVFDGLRTPLPHDVGAGEAVRLNAVIKAPDRAGKYTLEVTLVQEAVAWFPEREGDKLSLPIVVVDGNSGVTGTFEKHVGAESKTPVANRPIVQPENTRMFPTEKSGAIRQGRQEKPSAAAEKLGNVDAQQSRRTGEWAVQVGAFPGLGEAARLVENLRKKNYDAHVVKSVINGREWHQVRVGRLTSRVEAQQLQEVLKGKEGFRQSLVTK